MRRHGRGRAANDVGALRLSVIRRRAMAERHTRNRWFLMRHGEVRSHLYRLQRTYAQRRASLTPRDSFVARSLKVASSCSARA